MKNFLCRWSQPAFVLCALVTISEVSTVYAKCIQQCDPLDHGVQWLPINRTSRFDYESRSMLVTSDHAETEIALQARVHISRLDTCNYELRMEKANSSSFPNHRLQALNSWPVRFAFQFGRVQQICASDQEPQWSLNVKRSLLSSIQLHWSPSDSKQTREGIGKFLHGNCPFAYELLHNNATTKRIRLDVSLQQCKHRLTSIGSLHSLPQNEFDRFDSGLLVQSAQLKCDLLLSNTRQLQQVECLENARISPLIGSQLTSELIARQTLRLIQQHPTQTNELSSDESFNLITTIQFRPDFVSIETVSNQTERLLHQPQDASAEQILRLNQEMQQMKEKNLCDWILTTTTNSTKSSLIFDQLIQLATAESFSCIHRLMAENQFQLVNSRAFFNALTFARLSTENGLKQLLILHPLLIERLTPEELHAYFLSLGGYAHNLIRQTESPKQQLMPTIQKMVEQLRSEMAPNCDNSLDPARLRSLLHVRGFLNQATFQHVLTCLMQAKSSEQQLLTMQLLLANRNQMDSDFDEKLFEIFQNSQIHIETRLAIFSELIHQPRYQDILFDLTKKTQDEQLIAYISSYLENELNAKPEFKRDPFLKRVNLNTQTPSSLWKHSQNLVWQRKFGAHLATRLSLDLIRTKDYQLRTVRIMGEVSIGERRVELFEMTMRQSGLDQMTQDFLVKMLTTKSAFQDLFQRLTLAKSFEEAIQMLFKEVQQFPQLVSLKEVQITFNLKFNGNDLFYSRSVARPDPYLNQTVEHFLNQLNRMLPFIYLDQEHQLPLSCGWPLILELKGNFQNIFKFDWNQIFIKSLENYISASLGVRTDTQIVGLQVTTNSMVKVELGMQTNLTDSFVRVRLNSRDKNILFLKHEIVYFSRQPDGRRHELLNEMKPDMESSQCMHDNQNGRVGIWMTRWSGLACCIDRKQNGDWFAWNRPNFFFNQRHRMEASCSPIESEQQHWLFSFHRQANEINITYDTPGTAVSRNAGLQVQQHFNANGWQLAVQAQLAKQKINGNVIYSIWQKQRRKLNASLEWNKFRYRAAVVDVRIRRNSKTEHRTAWQLFKDPHPSEAYGHWKSSLAIDRGRKTVFSAYLLDQLSGNELKDKQMWRAFLALDQTAGQKWTGDLQLFRPLWLLTRAYLQLDLQEQHVSVDTQLEYSRAGKQQTVKLAYKTQNLTVAQLQKHNSFVQFQSSEFQSCNMLITHLFVYMPNWYIENELALHWPYTIEKQDGNKALTTADEHRYSIRHVGKYLPVSRSEKGRFHLLHTVHVQLGGFRYAGQGAVLWMPGDLPHLRLLVELGQRLSIQAETQLIQPPDTNNGTTLSSTLIPIPSSTGSMSAILKAASISGAAGNRLLLAEYRKSSNRPIRLSVITIVQLGGHWNLQYTDEVRERASNQYQGSTNLHWGRFSYARLEYVLRIQSNVLQSEYELQSEFTSSVLATTRLVHSADLRLQRNQMKLRSTAMNEQQPVWLVELDVDQNVEQSNSNKVVLHVNSALGKVNLNSYRTGEDQEWDLKVRSGRLDHTTNALFNRTTSDWRLLTKTYWQSQQMFLAQLQFSSRRNLALRLNCSKVFFLTDLRQQPNQSGELELRLPGAQFVHKSVWNSDDKELSFRSKTSHVGSLLLGVQLKTGLSSELSIQSWTGSLQAQWVQVAAKYAVTWTASKATGFVWHQGQAQYTPTSLRANCSSIAENSSRWMNATVQLNAQDLSWCVIQFPETETKLSANPFALEPHFEIKHLQQSLKEQIQILYQIGKKDSRQFRIARDWMWSAVDQQQLLQFGWTAKCLQQMHVKLAQQWFKLDWNDRKGFDIQIRLWRRLLRQALQWTSRPAYWAANVETFVDQQALFKGHVSSTPGKQGDVYMHSSLGQVFGSFLYDNETLASTILNVSLAQFDHQLSYVRNSKMFELRTDHSVGLPRQSLFNGLLRKSELNFLFKSETPQYQVECAYRNFGERKQGIADIRKRSSGARFLIELKSSNETHGVMLRWRPDPSKPSDLDIVSMIYPQDNSTLALSIRDIRAKGWYNSNATSGISHGELIVENRAEHWQQNWTMAVFSKNSSVLIDGCWKRGNQVLAKIDKFSVGLLNTKRPVVKLVAEIHGIFFPHLFHPIIGKMLSIRTALEGGTVREYLLQLKGDNIDWDIKISKEADSQIKMHLFKNHGQLLLRPFAPNRRLHLQGQWNELDYETHLKVEGATTMSLNSTTKHLGNNLLSIKGFLSLDHPSHLQVNGSQFQLSAALFPYQEVSNFTMDYENHATSRRHNTQVRYMLRGPFELYSLGFEKNQRWFEIMLNGNRKTGGWLKFQSGCCVQLSSNVSLSKDRRQLIGNYADESNQIKHHLNVTQYTDTTPVMESKSGSRLGGMFGWNRPSPIPTSSNKFGAKKVLAEPLNAFEAFYSMQREGQTEKHLHIWAPANGQGSATLESDRYKGEVEFSAAERRLTYRLWNQEQDLEEQMRLQYFPWLMCDASISRRHHNRTLYEYTLLMSPEQQRLLYQREPTLLEFHANLMNEALRTALFSYNQNEEQIQHRTQIQVSASLVGRFDSHTTVHNQIVYTLEANSAGDKYSVMMNSSSLKGQFDLSPYSALLMQFDLPTWQFAHRTQGQLGRQLLLETETKRHQRKVFWLRSNLHLTEFYVREMDGRFTYNDLRDLRLLLTAQNVTVHETQFLFDGTQLTLLIGHQPAGKHVLHLDLLASGTQVSHLRTNCTWGILNGRFAWLDWHRLVQLEVNSTRIQFSHQSELLETETLLEDKKHKLRTASQWMNQRLMESNATLSKNLLIFDTHLHSKLMQILFKSLSVHANRSTTSAQVDINFNRDDKSLNATGNAKLAIGNRIPTLISLNLDSAFDLVPTAKFFACKPDDNQTLEIRSKGHFKVYAYNLFALLDPRGYPLKVNASTKGQVNVALIQFFRNESNFLRNSLVKVGWNDRFYGYEANSADLDEWSRLSLHLRRQTAQLEWKTDVHSATARFIPNTNSTAPYEIRVQSHDQNGLNFFKSRYEIIHSSLTRPKVVDLHVDRLEKGNLTLDLLPDKGKALHLAYEFLHEFGLYNGRFSAYDRNRKHLDFELESFVAARNPLSGTAMKWKWLTKNGDLSRARYLLQLRGPEMLIIDDSFNRIELTSAQMTLPAQHDSSSPVTAGRLASNGHSWSSMMSGDRSLAFVQQLRVNERILQLQSAHVTQDQQCWTLALSDQVSPNVQQRLCVDRSYGAGVIKAQLEQWMAGLLQSRSTLTCNLDNERMQLHVKYNSKQWMQMMDSLRDLFANLQVNSYEWKLVQQELIEKQAYLEQFLLDPLHGDLAKELFEAIQEFQLQTISKTILKAIRRSLKMTQQFVFSLVERMIRPKLTEKWIHQWSERVSLTLHNVLQQVGTYNGNILQMINEWIQTLRQNYVSKVKRWLDSVAMSLLDVMSILLHQLAEWLQRRPGILAESKQLKQILFQIRQQLDGQRELVQTDRFNYIRKVVSLLSALFPPSAWFEPPNEFSWRRGELKVIAGNGR